MRRKDCDNFTATRTRCVMILAMTIMLGVAPMALAGTVRMWPTAVVVGDTIVSDDLCELTGFDRDTETAIRATIVAASPPTGGSRIVHMDLVRTALKSAGVNMATVTFAGSTTCSVARPSTPEQPQAPAPAEPTDAKARKAPTVAGENTYTLRQAIIDHFNDELARFGGQAELLFDHTGDGVLDLAGPPYEFRVRVKRNGPLGIVPIDVDISTEGRIVQSVSLIVNVALVRQVVTARRPISQNATIRQRDLDTTSMVFTRLDRLGIDDITRAVGQRSEVFVPAGGMIHPDQLVAVPVVTRGQLVRLESVIGAITVSTTAKATQNGLIGDVITVQATDNRRVKHEAVVVGPGHVRVGVLPDYTLHETTERN